MDTNRIIINTYDLSTVSEEQETTVATYTVVKSPRGPRSPIRIPAGSSAKIKDIFGVSSKNYPELFEVECINPSYDTYISAPYSTATVPVAYVTANGVFPAEGTVEYNTDVENLVNGIEDEDVDIPGITSIPSGKSILLNTIYPHSTAFSTTASDLPSIYSYPSYLGEPDPTLIIKTGLKKSEIVQKTSASQTLSLRIEDIPLINGLTAVNVTIKSDGIIYQTSTDPEATIKTETAIGNLTTSEGTLFEAAADDDELELRITGYNPGSGISVDTKDLLTSNYIQAQLALEETRSNISTFWRQSVTEDDVFGVIFPKYPSTDGVIHISFQQFNASRGYSNSTVSGRNILKMEVYDENAFHNINHSISITGSLDETAKSSSGSSIGFTSSNSDYADQDLICVYTIKPFTDTKEIGSTSITQYPSIVLKGGSKNFEDENTTSLGLHNIGWELAKEEEYSVVSYFFDSSRNTSSTIYGDAGETNIFFELAQRHALAGYIYNYTIAPGEINSHDVLSFGSNYWNICNEAIISLPNGNGKITSPCTGERTRMQCLAEEEKYGGAALMYLNSGGLGGQLNLTPLRMRYKYDKDQQTALDDRNFNPLILDHSYGLMCIGNRTSKGGETSDFSYISNTAPIYILEKEIVNQVLIPQIGKALNSYYYNLRKQQAEALLRKRLEGNNRIFAQAYVDTSESPGVNDDYAKRNKKFIMNVGIKQDAYSEYCILNLSVYDQSVDLQVINENTINASE